jgi:tetratricopeptide (TPR) repeat protein
MYEKAISIFQEVRGPDDPAVAWVLSNLGALSIQTGGYEAARQALERALQIHEKSRNPDPASLSPVLWELARVQLLEGDRDAAESTFERALEVIAELYGDDHPQLVYRQACLSCLLGDHEGALRGLRRAVDLGLEHDRIDQDLDLVPLHGPPGFEALVAELQNRAEAKE